jgi:hypothetical protein
MVRVPITCSGGGAPYAVRSSIVCAPPTSWTAARHSSRSAGRGYPGSAIALDVVRTRDHSKVSYTIFEGTSEIQRLVVARSISGLHIP